MFKTSYMEWVQEGFIKRAWRLYRNSPVDPDRETTEFDWAQADSYSAAIGMAYKARELFR